MIKPTATFTILLATTALAGCGSGPAEQAASIGPATAVTASPSARTPSPNGSVTSPSTQGSAGPNAVPTRLDQAMRQQLLAVPVDYYEAIEKAYRTLDYKPVEALSGPNCGGCRSQLEYLKEAAAKKYQHTGGEHTVTEVKLLGQPDKSHWSVSATVSISQLVIRDASGKVLSTDAPARDRRKQLDLTRRDGAWVVDRILGLA